MLCRSIPRLIMIRRARVSATRKLSLLARQYSREPRIMPGFVAFFKRSPQHELGKVFTTEHGVAPGEVRPHVLLDHRYPRHLPSGVRPRLPA